MILYGIAASGLIGLAIAVGLLAFGGGGASGASGALTEAGCTDQTFRAQNRDHVEALPKGFTYNSDPPSSGPHYPVPAPFDFYTDPVEQIRLVHNLEHGAVVIQYGPDVPQADIRELEEWYRDDPNGIVVAPHPALGDQVALTAWTRSPAKNNRYGNGHLAKCPGFDEGAADAFVKAYGFKGPEPFTRDMLQPGT